ncbi:MAG: GntR family transcriptional regulator [Eubacteriaceae bacterium]|nr:GntR family transcriptional regulator [Eubacteriaceae bacterium]
MINSENFDIERYKMELSRRINRMILSSINYEDLKPGIKIDIIKLSRKIGVKETSVIEALNLLSDYGLIEKDECKDEYYNVSEYSEHITKIYYTRSMLESNAAFLCARQLNCPNKERIYEIAEVFLKSDDVNIMKDADFEFHSLIIQSCGNEYIMKFYNSLA